MRALGGDVREQPVAQLRRHVLKQCGASRLQLRAAAGEQSFAPLERGVIHGFAGGAEP
jgi:hypothetical protein